MSNNKKLILKKDHCEIEILLDFNDCEIIQFDEEWVFIKPVHFDKIVELKKTLTGLLNKNVELYCDCKKIIYNDNCFEEVLKIKRNDVTIINNPNGILYTITVLVYGIWFSSKQSSYGPMVKLINCTPLNTNTGFLPDPDDYTSDQEIEDSMKYITIAHKNKKGKK